MKDNRTSVKRSLITSVIALALTAALLIGTTFAWFTSTAQADVDKIESGKLSVKLVDTDGNPITGKLTWQKEANHTNEDVLWEPGASYNLTSFKIKNDGNLALKCKLNVAGGIGDEKLLDVLDFTYTINGDTHNWGDEIKLAKDDTTELITVTATMDTNAGNTYQSMTLSGVTIDVVATQDTVEYDSTTKDYDKDATYPEGELVKAEDLSTELSTLEDNATITVTGTVSQALKIEKPVTINNLTTTAPVTIATDGVTLNGANISSDSTAVKVDSTVTNVTITNSLITASTGKDGSHTAVSLPASGKVVFTGNTVSNNYNGVEFGQGTTQLLGNGSIIANNTFKNIGNNAISIYRVADNATITIENNVFENVSNAIRLSNYPTSTSATFNIKSNTVDIENSWDNIFVLLQDTGNNDFTKYTLNFSGNTFNGSTVNYFKVYKDSIRGFATDNQPTVTGNN